MSFPAAAQVQNADDCAYEPGALPTLRIRLGEDDIAFRSNELGFSEKNVRALCSVGDSTKAAGDAGYIGQKGIGALKIPRAQAPLAAAAPLSWAKRLERRGSVGVLSPLPENQTSTHQCAYLRVPGL